jgi:two-component system, NarL family, response regulator NreC
MHPPIRVLIVEDHRMVRAGIRLLLESQAGVLVVGEAASGEQGIAAAQALQPDVVLMDIAMSGMSGLEATETLRQICPQVKVLVLTMHEDDSYFFYAVRAGAAGYVLKESSPEDLVGAIRMVRDGGVYFHPALARRLLDDYLSLSGPPGGREANKRALTQREHEILRMTASGRTTREIALALYLSPRTVERHRANIMTKMNLQNRAALIRYAVSRGLIDADLRPGDEAT